MDCEDLLKSDWHADIHPRTITFLNEAADFVRDDYREVTEVTLLVLCEARTS